MNDLVDVTEVEIVEGHTVWLRFDDGSEGRVDLGPRISYGPIFAELYADYDKFCQLYVDPELGTIAWPNGADLAPKHSTNSPPTPPECRRIAQFIKLSGTAQLTTIATRRLVDSHVPC